jgi:hypothetical protein
MSKLVGLVALLGACAPAVVSPSPGPAPEVPRLTLTPWGLSGTDPSRALPDLWDCTRYGGEPEPKDRTPGVGVAMRAGDATTGGLRHCVISVDGEEAAIAIYQSGAIGAFELRTPIATTTYGLRVGDTMARLEEIAVEVDGIRVRAGTPPMPLWCERDEGGPAVTCGLGTSRLRYVFAEAPGRATSGDELRRELAGEAIDRVVLSLSIGVFQEELDRER